MNIRFDGDAVGVFALLTETAIEQAKRTMNPLHNSEAWYNASTTSQIAYTIKDDAATAIFAATKQ